MSALWNHHVSQNVVIPERERNSITHAERLALLRQLADVLSNHVTDLAERMAREIGKPVRFGSGEVQRTAQKLRALADRAGLTGEPHAPPFYPHLRRRPHGLVAVITPYNNPIYLSLGKIAAAVMYGNRVAWKPAPEATELSRRLFQLLEIAGWPEELVTMHEGGRDVAAAVMDRPEVAAVTITGSAAAGAAAQEICTRRHIPLQAELGGNNAAIVWTDADLLAAARAIAAGAFEMAGQRCTANRRAIIHESQRDRFLELLFTAASELRWGDPLDPETQIGPLVNERQRQRVAQAVMRAQAQSAGTNRRPAALVVHSAGFKHAAWYPPTIICCDDPAADIVQEETFGPVLVVQSASTWDHAVSLCNGVQQGLAAAVFTTSTAVAERFLEEAQAGIVKINQSTADAAVDVPFGGWKASGIGLPEHGDFDREFYTRVQTVYRT